MEPENPPPPEAVLIRTAREAAGLTAAAAAKLTEDASGKLAVSATYWRDVERGHGGRRGQQAPARASAKTLAVMARVTGRVTPEQLDEVHREDAARVLREMLRPGEGSRPPVAPVQAPTGGDGDGEYRDRYMSLMLRADPRDVELLQIVGRALDPEGEPMPWRRKLEIAEQYLAEFTQQENGSAGTALRAACARCVLRAIVTRCYGVMPAGSRIDDNA